MSGFEFSHDASRRLVIIISLCWGRALYCNFLFFYGTGSLFVAAAQYRYRFRNPFRSVLQLSFRLFVLFIWPRLLNSWDDLSVAYHSRIIWLTFFFHTSLRLYRFSSSSFLLDARARAFRINRHDTTQRLSLRYKLKKKEKIELEKEREKRKGSLLRFLRLAASVVTLSLTRALTPVLPPIH